MLVEVCVSMTGTLTLLGPAYCYFVEKSQPWRNNTGEKMEKNCTVGYNFSIVMGFIPLYIRFVQCLRKYYYYKQPIHLYNAAKNFSNVMVYVAAYYMVNYLIDRYLWKFLAVKFFATTFSYVWDLHIDFGFFN